MNEREKAVAALLLQGCEDREIAMRLHMAKRTVKAYMNRMFVRHGITGGIKRVKLAAILYRAELCTEDHH